MTLGQRIREQRKRCGMSQESLAAQIGVSRQAVAKWETGQSTPATENLFRLAEVFGTTVDLLLPVQKKEEPSLSEQIRLLYRQEEAQRMATCRDRRRRNGMAFLGMVGCYLLIYLLGRVPLIGQDSQSVIGWLLEVDPQRLPYLYGWVVQRKLFWVALCLSAFPALRGRVRFSLATLAGFVLGLGLGELFGRNPAGAAYGHGHYGWAIWGGIFLLSILWGTLLELLPKGALLHSKKFWMLCVLFLTLSVAILLAIRLGIPQSYGG